MKLALILILVTIVTGTPSMQEIITSRIEKTTITITVTQAVTVTRIQPYFDILRTLSYPIHLETLNPIHLATHTATVPPSSSLVNQTTCTMTSSNTTAVATGGDITGLAVLGSFTVLLALCLVVTVTGWIYTAMISRRKDKATNIRLTEHTPSQPPTQTSHPHTDVMYDYIDKIPAPPPGSCDLTTNEAYDSVVHCVTNDSYSVVH